MSRGVSELQLVLFGRRAMRIEFRQQSSKAAKRLSEVLTEDATDGLLMALGQTAPQHLHLLAGNGQKHLQLGEIGKTGHFEPGRRFQPGNLRVQQGPNPEFKVRVEPVFVEAEPNLDSHYAK